mgnify:FL=1
MLDNIFNMDNIFFRIMGRIADLFILNVLWLICCIPVFTIGASTTAAYYCSINSISKEDGYITKMFFKSFKANFKQSTLIWLFMLAAGIVLSGDVYFWLGLWKSKGEMYAQAFLLISVILLALYVFILLYAFPLQSKFDNKVFVTLRNGFLISVKYFPQTLLMLFIPCIFVFLAYISDYGKLYIATLGSSSIFFLQAFVLKSIFKNHMPAVSDPIEEGKFNLEEIADELATEETTDNTEDTDNPTTV